MRIGICKQCNQVELIDKFDLCLSCTMENNPQFAKEVEEFQRQNKRRSRCLPKTSAASKSFGAY